MESRSKLDTIRNCIRHGKNILIIGPHGIGKTEAVRALVENEFPQYKCVYASVSQIHKADILAPFPVEKHGRRWMSYIPHDLFDPYDDQGNERPIVLVLDEFNRNLEEPDVYNALLEVMRSHSLCGVPLNLHCVVGLANPDKDGRYFNTSPLEITVLDRFTIKLYVDMYDLGADHYLLEKYPQHAPAVMEWVLSLPQDKQWLVPPRTQESIIEAYMMGEPVRYVFPEDVSLPVHQLEEAFRSGNVWTLKRVLENPDAARDALQRNPVLMPLFVALLRQIRSTKDARKVVPLLKSLPDAVRIGLWSHSPKTWTDVLTNLNIELNGSNENGSNENGGGDDSDEEQ